MGKTVLNLKGRGALLVGAKRIGKTIGYRMALEGISLAICYRQSIHEAEQLQHSVAELGVKTTLIQADVYDENQIKNLVKTAKASLGDLSFVVNLAGQYNRTPLDTLDGQTWDIGLQDAKASYLLALYAARAMENNTAPTRGHIIMTTDWAAKYTPYKDYLPYLSAKATIDFMTRAFAVELADRGILVNAIAPGPTQRPPEIDRKTWQSYVEAKTALHRESSTEEIAEMVVTLLKSETITGETIRIDSGRHILGACGY